MIRLRKERVTIVKENTNERKKVGEVLVDLTHNVGKITTDISTKAKSTVNKSQEAVLNAVDMNGNGEIDIEDVIIMGLKTPGIRINRSNFWHKEFYKNIRRRLLRMQ